MCDSGDKTIRACEQLLGAQPTDRFIGFVEFPVLGGPYEAENLMYIEPDQNPSARHTELNCVTEYGSGVYQSHWIVELHNDASTPA